MKKGFSHHGTKLRIRKRKKRYVFLNSITKSILAQQKDKY